MKQLGLTAWGGICIFAGIMSQQVMKVVNPPSNKSELLGQAMAAMLFMVVGVVMIGVGLVKNKQRR